STTISQTGPAAVISFAIAGFIILLVMRMLSEMAIALEGVHTFPDFARAGLGHLPGFISGWLYWYFWVVVVAIEAIAGAQIIHGWFPGIPELAIGIALMAVLTAVNLMSARAYGEFEFWFSSIKVAAIIVFILLCAAWAFGFTSGSGATFGNLTQHGGFVPNGWGVVIAAATSTIFSLVGAEIATIAAAESEEPAKVISKMTVSVTLRILIFYILSILLIVAVVPWTEIVPKQSPFAATLGFMGVPGGKLIMEAVVLVAVLSCLNSGMYVTSRALFGLAKHNDAPQWLVQVNARKVPARAILINSCGVTMLLLYLMTAGAQLKLRRRFEAEAPERLQIKMWFHPFGTYVAIAAMLGILVAKGLDKGASQELWLSMLVALAFVGGFFVFRRRKNSAA
ncbi:MAG: amino acid permease, partial [Sphingorhabdus sp.]